METKSSIEEVLQASNTSKERIFPILNKLDRFWTKNSHLQFCEIISILNIQNIETDLELTQRLEELNEQSGIK